MITEIGRARVSFGGGAAPGAGLSRSAEATEENVKQIALKRPTAESNAHPVSSSRVAGSAQPGLGRGRATAPPISAATGTIASVATPLSSLTSALATKESSDRSQPRCGYATLPIRPTRVARTIASVWRGIGGRPAGSATPRSERSPVRGDCTDTGAVTAWSSASWVELSGRGREIAGARWRRRGWICV